MSIAIAQERMEGASVEMRQGRLVARRLLQVSAPNEIAAMNAPGVPLYNDPHPRDPSLPCTSVVPRLDESSVRKNPAVGEQPEHVWLIDVGYNETASGAFDDRPQPGDAPRLVWTKTQGGQKIEVDPIYGRRIGDVAYYSSHGNEAIGRDKRPVKIENPTIGVEVPLYNLQLRVLMPPVFTPPDLPLDQERSGMFNQGEWVVGADQNFMGWRIPEGVAKYHGIQALQQDEQTGRWEYDYLFSLGNYRLPAGKPRYLDNNDQPVGFNNGWPVYYLPQQFTAWPRIRRYAQPAGPGDPETVFYELMEFRIAPLGATFDFSTLGIP